MQDQMAGGETVNLSGRAQVRALFLQPLVQAGLRRAPGVTVADHDAFLARLADRLAYCDAGALATLAEVTLRLAEGKLHNQWPSFATIWNTCQRVSRQPPPDEQLHIMTTWLRSRGGPVALAGGYLVELHGFLRRTGRPPGEYELAKIKEQGAENARTRDRLADKRARGMASPAEVGWLEQYLDQTAYCQGLVAGGERARADRLGVVIGDVGCDAGNGAVGNGAGA